MLTDCATQASLRQHHLFDRLPEPLFQEVCCLANHRRLEAGSALFHQGDTTDRFYLLLEGPDDPRPACCRRARKSWWRSSPPARAAEALLFSGARHYPVTASAFKPSNLVLYRRRALSPRAGRAAQGLPGLLGSLSVRLHQRLNEIDTLTLGNASRRVARYLCQEQEAGNGHIQLHACPNA